MAKILINDLFAELSQENTRLRNELLFANKCLVLFEKFRNYLSIVSLNCNCDQNSDTKLKVSDLESEYKNVVKQKSIDIIENTCNALHEKKTLIQRKHKIKVNSSSISLNNEKELVSQSIKNNKLKCGKCDEIFDESDGLVVHLKNVHNTVNKNTLKRSKYLHNYNEIERNCDFKAKNDFIVDNYASDGMIVPNELRRYRCNYPECDYTNNKLAVIESHINKVHTNERPFKCVQCDSTFTGRHILRVHERTIHSTVKYQCDYSECKFETTNFYYLDKHKLRHSTDKTFVCHCNKRFKSKRELVDHQKRMHTDVRPHHCEWPACDMAFKTPKELRSHWRTHTGERPYKCEWPGCDWSFAYHTGLRMHKKIHKEIKDYVCTWPQCEKKFRRRSHLNCHLMVHRGDRPIKCQWPQCDKRFTEKGNMRKHFKTHLNKSQII